MPQRIKQGQPQLRITCSPAWRDAVAAVAAAEGESLAAYAREAIDARREGRAAIAAEDREALARAVGQLRIAGRNINRLVMLHELLRSERASASVFEGISPTALSSCATALERAAAEILRRVRPR